jgi:hypothetical protein
MDLTWTEWDDLAKLNVRGVRQNTKDHLVCKRDTMNYIMMQVMEMKSSMRSISICEENISVEHAMWSSYLIELRPNYYQHSMLHNNFFS